jgi:hypothetical protein
MKIKKFHMCGNNSVCAGAFQLQCGRAPAQLRGNIGSRVFFSLLLCPVAALGPTESAVQRVHGSLSQRVKRRGRASNHSLSSCVED